MRQKRIEVSSQIWYNEFTTNHQTKKGETSDEYYNTRSKETSSGSEVCNEKRKKSGKQNVWSKSVKRKKVVQAL